MLYAANFNTKQHANQQPHAALLYINYKGQQYL